MAGGRAFGAAAAIPTRPHCVSLFHMNASPFSVCQLRLAGLLIEELYTIIQVTFIFYNMWGLKMLVLFWMDLVCRIETVRDLLLVCRYICGSVAPSIVYSTNQQAQPLHVERLYFSYVDSTASPANPIGTIRSRIQLRILSVFFLLALILVLVLFITLLVHLQGSLGKPTLNIRISGRSRQTWPGQIRRRSTRAGPGTSRGNSLGLLHRLPLSALLATVAIVRQGVVIMKGVCKFTASTTGKAVLVSGDRSHAASINLAMHAGVTSHKLTKTQPVVPSRQYTLQP